MNPLVKVQDLSVRYYRRGKAVDALRGVSLDIQEGETIALVGESGSGKSTLALSLLRLLPENESHIPEGRIIFQERDLLKAAPEELRRVRGGDIGIVFQDPFSSLNPVLTVGEQLEEVLEAHGGRNRAKVLEALGEMQLPETERVYASYPHQISGGQRQRVCLAMAILSRPKLLIADEPTTALDVTTQREILALLDRIQRDRRMAMLLITHNLGLVAERTHRLAVMYAGQIVEIGPTASVLAHPLHPYTQELLRSLPRLSQREKRLSTIGGHPPDLLHVPSGCPFHPRCPKVFDPCPTVVPQLLPQNGNRVSCHLYPAKTIN